MLCVYHSLIYLIPLCSRYKVCIDNFTSPVMQNKYYATSHEQQKQINFIKLSIIQLIINTHTHTHCPPVLTTHQSTKCATLSAVYVLSKPVGLRLRVWIACFQYRADFSPRDHPHLWCDIFMGTVNSFVF